MKSLLVLLFALASFSAMAQVTPGSFASCAGDHHGTYLEFKNGANGGISIETSNDSDDAPEKWTVLKVTKSLTAVPKSGQSWAIRQAIKAANASDGSYDMVMVEAKRGTSTMYVQLNKWNGESFLSVMGFVEKLECR